jgi:hypothetical protein
MAKGFCAALAFTTSESPPETQKSSMLTPVVPYGYLHLYPLTDDMLVCDDIVINGRVSHVMTSRSRGAAMRLVGAV